ncbi:calcium-binding protein [Alloyangia pacifica]|uniref:Hemolysin-type calcium-binding repeat-containing protein n=1 Tax=Alloyangia pacifica TaxID=311180 RepID=A0A1I6TRE9_9RHOB|nr:calcium-binding protein [Alloyangia pacifica]SDH09398.1 Hemolysin-type calcium-binding repeat-containing protein [Alloyangia pacifica]SFS91751.1 Hemolysin-type calcium-binding repeat-containing protein [Alloyangia pacifica]
MLMLAGLMGMALLGSLAVFAMPDSEEDANGAPEEPESARADDTATSFDTAGDELPEAVPSEVNVAEVLQPGGQGTGSGENAIAPGETLEGTSLTDMLAGGAGADLIDGQEGDDELRGGDGADTLLGGPGNDTLHGDAGGDVLRGGAGNDLLFAHDGGGVLDGGMGDDVLQGGLGADDLTGGAGQDALHGREGADTLIGGRGVDTLFGGAGGDTLSGVVLNAGGSDVDGTDYLNGGAGDDLLWIGRGDVVSGGDGADSFLLGDWIAGGEAAELMDFDPQQDQIVVVWSGAEAPVLELRASAEEPGMTEICADGEVLALLPAADMPGLETIALIEAQQAGLPGAA